MKKYHRNPVSLLLPGLFLLLLLSLLSCNTPAKQLKKTQEYLFKHPDFSVGYCAEQYPLIPGGIDSSKYLSALKEIDSLLNASDNTGGENDQVNDSLRNIIKNMIDNGWNDILVDTACTSIYKYAASLLKENDNLKAQLSVLKSKVRTIPPLHDTIRDYAREKELYNSLDKCIGNTTVLQAKNDSLEQQLKEWKDKAKKRWWIIFVIIGAITGITLFKIWKKIKPKPASTLESFYKNMKA